MAQRVELPRQLVAGLRAEVSAEELPDFFGRAVEAAGRIPAGLVVGPVTAVYHADAGDRFDVTIGLPVSDPPDDPGLEVVELPAGPALLETHIGPYPELAAAYRRVGEALAELGVERTLSWERYLVGPADDPDPAVWRTQLLVPLPAPPGGAD